MKSVDILDLRDAGLIATFAVLDSKIVELAIRAMPILAHGHKENFVTDQFNVGILFATGIGSLYFVYELVNDIRLRQVHRQ